MRFLIISILLFSSFIYSQPLEYSSLQFTPFPHNTGLQEFGPALSEDGNTLFFYSKRDNSIYTDLYISHKVNGTWSKPEEISALNSNYDDQSPYYDSEGKFIIFSSNRDGAIEFSLGNGKTGVSRDLFISFLKNGKWSIPRPLSPQINSAFNEENPYLYGSILLFTRYPFGHVELAKIYRSEFKDGVWSKPQILAEPVNDGYASISASISKDGKYVYFSSNRPGGFGGFDIYRAPILEKGMGKPENLGQNVNTELDEAYLVHNKNDVLFCRKIDKINYDIFMNDQAPANAVLELEKNQKLVTDNIYFHHDSAEILQESRGILDAIAGYLLQTKKKIKITGHTDNTGDADYNLQLSKQRAHAVREYFLKKGIPSNRMSTDGKGATQPISEEKYKNRRTEFQLEN